MKIVVFLLLGASPASYFLLTPHMKMKQSISKRRHI